MFLFPVPMCCMYLVCVYGQERRIADIWWRYLIKIFDKDIWWRLLMKIIDEDIWKYLLVFAMCILYVVAGFLQVSTTCAEMSLYDSHVRFVCCRSFIVLENCCTFRKSWVCQTFAFSWQYIHYVVVCWVPHWPRGTRWTTCRDSGRNRCFNLAIVW